VVRGSWRGTTSTSKRELIELFDGRTVEFATPKPTSLIELILDIGAGPDALILDSFAGSGTTAHAVLKANAKDGGNRRFILVEGEDYADTLTAERVRRAIKGYAWVRHPARDAAGREDQLHPVQEIGRLAGPVEADQGP
jgi:adenine-specific DNA-methyltransferase